MCILTDIGTVVEEGPELDIAVIQGRGLWPDLFFAEYVYVRPGLPSRIFVNAMIKACVITANKVAWVWGDYANNNGSHRINGNRKRSKQSTNVDQKSLETVFLIALCRQAIKKLFLTMFDLRWLIVLTFSIDTYPVCG